MPLVKATDIAFARLQVPDMDIAEQFLLDFGLQRAERTATALYMRGTDPDPFIYVAHLGDAPRFLSSAWHVASEDDLKAAARVPGASPIENLDEPGGGRRVRLTDPIGYTVELVHGRQPVAAIPVEPVALNFGWDGLRRKTLQRFDARPSIVKKIAHVVLTTPDVPPVVQWYRETLGLVQSEDIYSGAEAEHHWLIQSLRSRRHLRRSSRIFLPRRKKERSQSCVLRGAGLRRSDAGSRSFALQEVQTHVGRRPSSARRSGVRLLVRPMGPRA